MNFITSRLGKRLGRRIELEGGIKTLYGVGTLITVLSVLGSLLAVATIAIHKPQT